MNEFEKGISVYIGEENLFSLQKYKIGIAGAGGIGSNCGCNLVRCGFKNFVIADFDIVEYSNLNRQFYFNHQTGKPKVNMLCENLLLINPDLNLNIENIEINKNNLSEIFHECDVVVEAFDDPKLKKIIVEEYINSEKLLVAVSGIAGFGNSDNITIHKIREKFFIVGDLKSEVSGNSHPYSPVVNIAAAKQADIILNYLINKPED